MHQRIESSIRTALLLAAAATVAAAAEPPKLPKLPFECDCETSLYAPQQEHFEPRYKLDEPNAKVQNWKDYWYWVRVFYDTENCEWWPPSRACFGNRKGWTADAETTLGCAGGDDPVQRQVRATLNRVGWYIATEWSKDNGVRKISTQDLQGWGKRLDEACGDGADATRAALAKLEQEVASKLGL